MIFRLVGTCKEPGVGLLRPVTLAFSGGVSIITRIRSVHILLLFHLAVLLLK